MAESLENPQLIAKKPEVSVALAVEAKIPEILAPVGGREQFFAALNAGADAVFLGLKQFNARSRAENFTLDDLQSLVPLAHRYGMKVLVTLNILIKDMELPDLIDTLAALEEIGVHAIIVQDLGVARIAKEHFPGLRLHASTQMAVHNLAGVKEAIKYGFKRVVLARELTAEEIKRIRKATNAELEVFCHGSLCYSYSGLCFFSGAADARSGNRGECAYTCREPYKVISEPGHGFLFSMRDLDTSHKLDQMIAAGVDTLKIEGRKKDAQYVTSVVRLYRKKLDQLFGRSTLRQNAPPLAKEVARDQLGEEAALRKDLQLSFQRQTTSFFFEGRYHENVIDLNNPTHHGIRVGIIESVNQNSMSVRLEDDVEKFDGLKVVPVSKLFHAKPQDGESLSSDVDGLDRRYSNREIAFSLRELVFKGRNVFEATRGMIVEIGLPAGSAKPQVGDELFKSRSDELRRRVERMIGVPVDARLRPMLAVQTRIFTQELDDGSLKIGAVITRARDVIAEGAVLAQAIDIRQKGDFTADLKETFHIFGEQGVYTEEFSFLVAQNYFVPRSLLKDLKRQIEPGLADSIVAISERHAAEAFEAIENGLSSLSTAGGASGEFNVALKIDRIDYLPWIQELLGEVSVKELVFEPKKMFLPDIKPEVFIKPLIEFQQATGLKLRLAVPTVVRAWDEPVLKIWFKAALEAGIRAYEVGNPGALELLHDWGMPVEDLASDFMLYALNREAVKHWRDQGVQKIALSIEDDAESLTGLLEHWPEDAEPQAILYKDTPLFVAEACSLTALHNGCPSSKVCGYRTLEIENSKGERFFVAHEGCKSIVYGKRAFSVAAEKKRLESLGVKNFRLDFLTRDYDRATFLEIVRSGIAGKEIAETHTANFYGRLK